MRRLTVPGLARWLGDPLESAHDVEVSSLLVRCQTMTSEIFIAREVDEGIRSWQASVLHVLLVFSSVIMLLPLLAVLTGRGIELPWQLRAVCVMIYLLPLLATLRPRWNLLGRAWLLFVPIGAIGTIQLAVGQLAGSGRISLLLVPLLSLLLVGPRAGWVAVALVAALFGLVPPLLRTGWWTGDWAAIAGVGVSPAYWGLQWGLWLIVLLTLMILFTRFQILQRRTMIAELTALKKLEAEFSNRRRLEAEVARVSEAERRSLGSELHDGLCQNLTAALLNCTALENRQMAAGNPDVAEVARIREAIEESIDTAHNVARGLCPVDLEAEGLTPALESICHAVYERRGLACELQADPLVAADDPDQALQLYRIAGEAITNAVKHAACSRVTVRLARYPGELVLSVADNGKGISGESGEGLGRQIMAYRAGLIGGSLTISGVPGQGTTVTCRIPDLESGA